jgi:hypothetical protein
LSYNQHLPQQMPRLLHLLLSAKDTKMKVIIYNQDNGALAATKGDLA